MTRIGPGHFFGEIGLIFGGRHIVTVTAVSHCELLILKRSDLDEVLVDFPLIARYVEQYLLLFFLHLKLLQGYPSVGVSLDMITPVPYAAIFLTSGLCIVYCGLTLYLTLVYPGMGSEIRVILPPRKA